MYNTLQHFHSLWAYSAIGLTLLAAIISGIQWSREAGHSRWQTKISFYALLAMYIQFALGMVLYFNSPITTQAFADMAATMKDPLLRLYVVEHPASMVMAILAMTMGYFCLGKASCDRDKHKRIALSYTIALFLVLGRLPYAAWWL